MMRVLVLHSDVPPDAPADELDTLITAQAIAEALDERGRADWCRNTYGGRWFAEAYIEGREFNVSVLEENGAPRVLPIPEMCFHNWREGRPRVVGYAAKWEEESSESLNTVRHFILEKD